MDKRPLRVLYIIGKTETKNSKPLDEIKIPRMTRAHYPHADARMTRVYVLHARHHASSQEKHTPQYSTRYAPKAL